MTLYSNKEIIPYLEKWNGIILYICYMNKWIKKITDLHSQMYIPFRKPPEDRPKHEVYAHFFIIIIFIIAFLGALISIIIA